MSTIKFGNQVYAVTIKEVTALDTPPTIFLDKLSGSDLAMLYNIINSDLKTKTPPISRFSDKEVGLCRTWTLLSDWSKKNSPKEVKIKSVVPEVKTKSTEIIRRTKRGFRFVFPILHDGEAIRKVRPNTMRSKLIEILSREGGATFEECLAETWALRSDMTPKVQTDTCYEGLRLIHYIVGYGMRQDKDTGKITLFS